MKKLRFISYEEKVQKSLWCNSEFFIAAMGMPEQQRGGLLFPTRTNPFNEFMVCYQKNRKFLGSIYSMVVSATLGQTKEETDSHGVKLCYTGFISKGLPVFKPQCPRDGDMVKSRQLADRLNARKHLLVSCRDLDLELFLIDWSSDRQSWMIHIRPYGGSFVHLTLPPINYNVILPKAQASSIFRVIHCVGQILKEA